MDQKKIKKPTPSEGGSDSDIFEVKLDIPESNKDLKRKIADALGKNKQILKRTQRVQRRKKMQYYDQIVEDGGPCGC